MYVAAVEVGYGEVSVETDMFQLMCGLQCVEPVGHCQLRQNVVVDVNLKAEDFALLERGLRIRVRASCLAVLVTML